MVPVFSRKNNFYIIKLTKVAYQRKQRPLYIFNYCYSAGHGIKLNDVFGNGNSAYALNFHQRYGGKPAGCAINGQVAKYFLSPVFHVFNAVTVHRSLAPGVKTFTVVGYRYLIFVVNRVY